MTSEAAEASLPNQSHVLSRVTKKPILMHHNRLLFTVWTINLVYLYFLTGDSAAVFSLSGANSFGIGALANMVIVNFFVAIVIRQHYVVNFLFWVATRAPQTWPLWIRWNLGKVYHFGGIHIGCASSGTLWFLGFVFLISSNYMQGNVLVSTNVMGVSYALVGILCLMTVLALPGMRAKFHDLFERSHRFGGWTALILFWAFQTTYIYSQYIDLQHLATEGETPFIQVFLSSWQVWLLIGITFSIALPWLRLKKVPIEITNPSPHVALAKFDYGVTPFAGSSTALSRNPLLEWHSFANVPSPHEPGFRLTISRAGDWTGKFIDDLPSHIWVKSIPTAGVANIEVLFKKVVYVATGSGIGPCLPHLLAQEVPARLVWATREPRKTYGDQLVDEILDVQPDAVIWDTDRYGKPDLLELAYRAYVDFDAEAVICISNKKLTWQIVYGMESRGIPAYGAIWDS